MHLTIDDYLAWVGVTLDGFRTGLGRLDDDSVNEAPDPAGANTPFVLVTHATGSARWWLCHLVAGQTTDRVRSDEFVARGTVADAMELLDALQADLAEVAGVLDEATEIVHDVPRDGEWTVGRIFMHAYEELCQHLGHFEITVDLVEA